MQAYCANVALDAIRVLRTDARPIQVVDAQVEPVVGFEPTTDGLQNRCSTTELNWLPKSCQAFETVTFECHIQLRFDQKKSKLGNGNGRFSITARLPPVKSPPKSILHLIERTIDTILHVDRGAENVVAERPSNRMHFGRFERNFESHLSLADLLGQPNGA
jgi:hypothetical protein